MSGPGERLFARYAYAPNALGYCGPAAARDLQEVAGGRGEAVDVRRIARQFSGAWPYQLLIGELTGRDPLAEDVGRAYWTGNELTGEVDARELGRMLLDRFAGQARHYWSHLTEELLDEVTPTHIFHVLGVYPWSRLLVTGLPEPLHVLDSCRIRAGEVVSVDGDSLTVDTDTLTYAEGRLALAPTRAEGVGWRQDGRDFVNGRPERGDLVAVHWDFACDRLDPDQSDRLNELTQRQLLLTNRRLVADG